MLGYEFCVHAGVFSPALSRSTELFASVLVQRCGGRKLLEIGCGTGCLSILAARNGSTSVVAGDINPIAVQCTQKNVDRHGVSKFVDVRLSDVFSDISGRFDLLVFALPYVCVPDVQPYLSRFGPLAYSMLDENFRAQRSFLRGAIRYLRPGGEVLLQMGDVGGMSSFFNNVAASGFECELIACEREGRADNRIYSLKPAKTPPPEGRVRPIPTPLDRE